MDRTGNEDKVVTETSGDTMADDQPSTSKRAANSPLEQDELKKSKDDKDEVSSEEDFTVDSDTLKFITNFSCALRNSQIKKLLGEIVHDKVEQVTQEMENRLRALESKSLGLEIENKDLRTQVDSFKMKAESLEDQLNELAQYSRRNSLRVANPWEEKPGENTDELVKEMSSTLLSVELTDADIGRSHRIGPKRGNTPRSIVVGFTSYRARQKLYLARTKLAHRHAGDAGKNIYINEHLTPQRAHVAASARNLKKDGAIQDTWTSDGKIFVKEANGRVTVVTTRRQLAWFGRIDEQPGDGEHPPPMQTP